MSFGTVTAPRILFFCFFLIFLRKAPRFVGRETPYYKMSERDLGFWLCGYRPNGDRPTGSPLPASGL